MEDLDKEIEKAKWTFAKTYATRAPHEYIVRQKYPELFEKLCEKIEKEGKRELFSFEGKKSNNKYWRHGNYRYWRIGIILNRCNLDDLVWKDGVSYPKVD